MVTRSAVRAIACDKLAQWEREARVGAQGLKTTVEANAVELLTKGVDLPPDATEGDRTVALQEAWARVDEGRTRADALRLVSRVLRRILLVLGGEPIYDREAPPETVRQARVAMFVEREEERAESSGGRAPAHEAGDLNKAWVVQHAAELEAKLGWPPFLDTCSGCALAASKGRRKCILGENCEGLVQVCGHPGFPGVCGPCIHPKGHTYDHGDKTPRRWKVDPGAA